ncbi:MAG: CHASE2 domain-containing protein [Pyrinomonadaceae bacterium]
MVKKKRRAGRLRTKTSEAEERPKVGLWRRLLRIIPAVFVTFLLVLLFSRLGVLHKLQTFVSDTMMRLNAPPAPSDVAIVDITDEDYKEIFGGKSPLDAAKLRLLIDLIARGNPKVIAVDISTSAEGFKEIGIDDRWPPVVWERDPLKVPEFEDEPPEALDVLGGRDPRLNDNSGMPLLFDDAEDGMTRRYRRLIKTADGSLLPSFPWAIISKFPTAKTSELTASTDKYFIRYAGDAEGTHRFNLTASRLIELSKGAGLPEDNPLKDRIVLLGGTYGDDDKHFTPLGRMDGIQVIAQVVETELQGGGDKAPNHAAILLLEIFEGVLVILLFHAFHSLGFVKATLLNLLSVLVIAVICSYLAFGSMSRATFFIPVLICVLIYEFAVEYRVELVKKLSGITGGESHDIH